MNFGLNRYNYSMLSVAWMEKGNLSNRQLLGPKELNKRVLIPRSFQQLGPGLCLGKFVAPRMGSLRANGCKYSPALFRIE